ncbi:helix-turn-helix domain-containing protein [Pelistega europaea]|uniref:Helix-turn-helix transcriptional regulator n=1 Tax=Pelistega europaea TaxID=106147 RepID=A0A7Y4LAK6_9BURK|nr:XRE family transcriptional regulator [Pelistega europaea]NOL49983.1 helix-turn-helix transcriptional regulator [Pelistega europaea]
MDTSSVNMAVANKIKNYRQQHKLSLDVLAQKAGISKGMLVDIENHKANPSIATLCKLAIALGISVAELVSLQEIPTIRLISQTEMPVLWKGTEGGEATLLAGSKGATMIELWRWILQPGESYVSAAHSRGTVELVYVHKGCLCFSVGNHQLRIKAGQAAIGTTDQPHTYQNTGKTKVEFTLSVVETPSD